MVADLEKAISIMFGTNGVSLFDKLMAEQAVIDKKMSSVIKLPAKLGEIERLFEQQQSDLAHLDRLPALIEKDNYRKNKARRMAELEAEAEFKAKHQPAQDPDPAPAALPAAPVVHASVPNVSTPSIQNPIYAPVKKLKKRRRDLLSPLIEKAQSEALDKFDAAEIMLKLRSMVNHEIGPLYGIVSDGIEWGNDPCERGTLTMRNLRDRLRKLKNKQY